MELKKLFRPPNQVIIIYRIKLLPNLLKFILPNTLMFVVLHKLTYVIALPYLKRFQSRQDFSEFTSCKIIANSIIMYLY